MNILQIVPELNVGGVETGTIDLAKVLTALGHRCVVISAGGTMVSELEIAGITHYKLPVENKAFWVMLKAARQVARIIRDEKIDIVHARSRVPAWIGFMGSRGTSATFVTTAHGHYSRHIFSAMMGGGKFTIVPSSMIGKHMIEDFGVPLENIRLIPRSVDLERYLFRDRAPKSGKEITIGVIGRIAPIKGQIYFLKAMAKVLRSMPHVKALIVGGVSPGKDNYMEELETWRRRLGLTQAVEFLGNRRDIPQILEKLDCLVMPSIAQESFGRVIVEAQAIGVPVVATKVGGVVEIIDDKEDGLLVDSHDHEGLADAILEVLQNPALAQRMAVNGRKKVEAKFSLKKMAEDTLKVYEEALAIRRFLVIKIGAVGDSILSIPSFEALKKKFPQSRIVCLVGRGAKDVFERCPYIDELIVCDFKGRDRGLKGMWRLAQKLAHRRFDAVIDLQNNKKSHLLSYATFSSHRYGYDNGKFSFLLNHKVKDSGEFLQPVEHQFRVLKMLGVDYRGEGLALWPSAEDEAFAANFLKNHLSSGEILVGINIGASLRWPNKRWLPERFAQLCDELARENCKVLLTGASFDAASARAILKKTKSAPLCAVAQTTLMQLASLIKKCGCFVTGDSAPMHVAAAMQTPFVALFGPTDHRRHLPPASACVVFQKNCPPCYKSECKNKNIRCMKDISVKEVKEAVLSLAKKVL